MGLISWIKNKYYDHRLESGDMQFADGNWEKAEEIFSSLLGKQNDAIVHLAGMYVKLASSCESKIKRLHQIEELKRFENENNSKGYQKELFKHVENIYGSAQEEFSSKSYKDAVSLIESIRTYKDDSKEYQDRFHRYNAYLAFSNSQASTSYSLPLNRCIEELSQINKGKEEDIRTIRKELMTQKKFRRAIDFLLPFKKLNKEFQNDIVSCIVEIVSYNDKELKEPEKISDFCIDNEICILASRELADLAVQLAKNGRYSDAVLYDGFASEFLSNDNLFNNTRCQHILENCNSFLNCSKISDLFRLTSELKLSNTQIDSLKARLVEMLYEKGGSKAIEVCRLFMGEKKFDQCYVDTAAQLVSENQIKVLDEKELRDAINNITDEHNHADTLAIFVDYMPAIQKEFYDIVHGIYDSGDKNEAYAICSKIECHQKSWIPLYIELRNKDDKGASTLIQTIQSYQSTTEKIIATCNDLGHVSDARYSELWENYAQAIIKKSTSQPKEKAIESLVDFREKVYKYCKSVAAYQKIVESLTGQVVKVRWSYAVELEGDCRFAEAIEQYNAVVIENDNTYTTRAYFRSLISAVKSGSLTLQQEEQIKDMLGVHSFEALRDDLAYRYALYLLKNTRPGDAEWLLKKYMPDERGLLGLCDNIFIKEAEDRLEEFNGKLKAMEEGSLSLEEAEKLYNFFDFYEDRITKRLKDTASIFPSYKGEIETYILCSFFNEEKYSTAFDKLQELQPDFIYKEDAFRNMAIASIGLLENGEQDQEKIKQAISIWLSAVYTDKLFVRSLDYTTWDDPFTFTLLNSLGNSNEDDFDEMPENINFDNAIENQNIAIKEVQNSLLIRIETVIRENYESFESFYNSEKASIEGLIDLNLDSKCILATPYLAKMNEKLKMDIGSSLDFECDVYGEGEDVLSIGVAYGITGGGYDDYRLAKNYAEDCCSAVKGSLQSKKYCFTETKIQRIEEFDNLYSIVKSAVSTAMNESIKDKTDYAHFLDQYEHICEILDETALSMTCANYVNGEVVHRLNDNTLKERDGVGYLVRAFNLAPSNIQIKKNLEAIIGYLACEAEKNSSSYDAVALKKAIDDTNGEFVEACISGKLNGIVDKVNNDKMKKDEALRSVYELYQKSPNNDKVCENLVAICDICITDYIINRRYSSIVNSVLNSLVSNKSATFKRHAIKLKDEYDKIWSKLSWENQRLMMGLTVPGTSLNDAGHALKKGLDYYRKLGVDNEVGPGTGRPNIADISDFLRLQGIDIN